MGQSDWLPVERVLGVSGFGISTLNLIMIIIAILILLHQVEV
jgi:hypothetical protein